MMGCTEPIWCAVCADCVVRLPLAKMPINAIVRSAHRRSVRRVTWFESLMSTVGLCVKWTINATSKIVCIQMNMFVFCLNAGFDLLEHLRICFFFSPFHFAYDWSPKNAVAFDGVCHTCLHWRCHFFPLIHSIYTFRRRTTIRLD